LAYKYLWRVTTAGQNDTGPFPTYLRWFIHPRRLMTFFSERGLQIVYFAIYEGTHMRRLRARSPMLSGLFQATCRIMNCLSVGRLGSNYSDYHLIVRKSCPQEHRT